MNPSELPKVGVISNAGGHDFFGRYSELAGKRLLCVGFAEEEVDHYVAPHAPESITLLTNWADHKDARIAKYPLTIGDITKRTSFEDDSFDAVLTLSVLEHLNDLQGAFAEMLRVTRNGGEQLHMFGPAWSCAYGHHTYADADDANLNFVKWQMPAHMHLLCTDEEIHRYYAGLGYAPETAQTVLHWFRETPFINRIFYDDYMTCMTDPSLHLDMMELMTNDLPDEHLKLLREKFPGRWDFSTYGGRYRLGVRK